MNTIHNLCYLNGQYLPLEEARISPLDRGFLFGDAAYELIPVYARHPFQLLAHLRRLQQTLEGIRLANPLTNEAWQECVMKLVTAAPYENQSVYLQVTRGTDKQREHAFPKNIPATVFAFTAPLLLTPDHVRQTGVSAITAKDPRWLRCDLKVTNLLPNVLARQTAIDQHCAETIFVRDGCVIEGSASNVFLVKQGVLLAPQKDQRMLPGVTYDLILTLAAQYGLPYVVRDIAEAELQSADEIWLTSSTKEILPVTKLDTRPVGDGHPGPIAEKMYFWYQKFKNEVMVCG